jgi:hypothetical protein
MTIPVATMADLGVSNRPGRVRAAPASTARSADGQALTIKPFSLDFRILPNTDPAETLV